MPLENVKKILEDAKRHFLFSGAQLYAKNPSKLTELNIGATSYWPGAVPITAETLFDIGSVTKVVATTSILARLYERNKIRLDQKLSELLPNLKSTPYENITLFQILTHTAGFLAWYPMYKEANPQKLLEWYKKSSDKILVSPPGHQIIYSDLGFILLGEVLETQFGKLQELFLIEVVRPLKLESTTFGPVSGNVAATEYDMEKGKPIWGEVFDENARFLNEIAPHAGLFSNAQDVGLWCSEWLKALSGASTWISQKTAQLFTQRTGERAIGFDMKSEKGSSAGTLMSRSTFGHLGYTGCSVWIDPEKELSIVLLSNRVHPSRVDERIRQLRPALHDAVVHHMEGT